MIRVHEESRMLRLVSYFELDIPGLHWPWSKVEVNEEDRNLTKAEAQAIVEGYLLEHI